MKCYLKSYIMKKVILMTQAEIAQLVEHFTRNEGVVGSSPIFSFQKNCVVDFLYVKKRKMFLHLPLLLFIITFHVHCKLIVRNLDSRLIKGKLDLFQKFPTYRPILFCFYPRTNSKHHRTIC